MQKWDKEKTLRCLLSLCVAYGCAMKCGGGPTQPTYHHLPKHASRARRSQSLRNQTLEKQLNKDSLHRHQWIKQTIKTTLPKSQTARPPTSWNTHVSFSVDGIARLSVRQYYCTLKSLVHHCQIIAPQGSEFHRGCYDPQQWQTTCGTKQ